MSNFLEESQDRNRAARQEMIDEEVAIAQVEDIVKAAAAMIEAKIKEKKVKELLSKYENIRPSDAAQFIEIAKQNYFEAGNK